MYLGNHGYLVKRCFLVLVFKGVTLTGPFPSDMSPFCAVSPCCMSDASTIQIMTRWLERIRGCGARNGASEPLFQALWRWPAAFLAHCASSSPAAAASFPGTEPSLFLGLLHPDLDRTGRKTGVRFCSFHNRSIF